MIQAKLHVDFSKLDKLESQLPKRLRTTAKKIADAVAQDIKSSWSPISPSDWGSAPAVVTGQLNDSIKTGQGRDEAGRFEGNAWLVYSDDVTGKLAALEEGRLNRPFMLPALQRAEALLATWYEGIFWTDGGGDE